MNEICPSCACRLDGDCCGNGEPFELAGISYCCEACARDEDCTCGCGAATTAVPAGTSGIGASGPLL